MSTKNQWLNNFWQLSSTTPDITAGNRIIVCRRSIQFSKLDNSLQLDDIGFTRSKLTMLTKAYLHEESRNTALEIWDYHRKRGKYASSCFSCFNHLVKNHSRKRLRATHDNAPVSSSGQKLRHSIQGPCLQSVVLTLHNRQECSVDVTWRTTELGKKFPADLILLRDVLLRDFDLQGLREINCYFINASVAAPYYIVVLASTIDWERKLEALRKANPKFHATVCKWLEIFLNPKYFYRTEKFMQLARIKPWMQGRMDKRTIKEMNRYAAGYSNYEPRVPVEEEDDE